MTLTEMKKKVLKLIEEISDTNPSLTDDPDIENKLHDVTNQILYELARIKKIPGYVEMNVSKGELLDFEKIENESGYAVYQIDIIRGVEFTYKAQGTIIKVLSDGIAEIDFFRYPERITEKTKGNYEFELSQDALEIMPYGIAADLLKSDVSADYGKIYAQRYETMLQRLDPRYKMSSFTIEGGVDI